MMTKPERAAWKRLPDCVTAYRCCYHNNRDGFCYFLSRAAAEKFGSLRQYHQDGRKDRGIVVAEIPKKHCFLKRGKLGDEIIATRPDELRPQATLDGRGRSLR